MLGGGRARAGAGARRPLSRDSKVGGQGEEGLGGACARIRGAGLETHKHRRGHKLGTCVTLGAHGTVRYFGSPRVPSAERRLRTLFAAGSGAGGLRGVLEVERRWVLCLSPGGEGLRAGTSGRVLPTAWCIWASPTGGAFPETLRDLRGEVT